MRQSVVKLFVLSMVACFAASDAASNEAIDDSFDVVQQARTKLSKDYLSKFAATLDHYYSRMGMEKSRVARSVYAAESRECIRAHFGVMT